MSDILGDSRTELLSYLIEGISLSPNASSFMSLDVNTGTENLRFDFLLNPINLAQMGDGTCERVTAKTVLSY